MSIQHTAALYTITNADFSSHSDEVTFEQLVEMYGDALRKSRTVFNGESTQCIVDAAGEVVAIDKAAYDADAAE